MTPNIACLLLLYKSENNGIGFSGIKHLRNRKKLFSSKNDGMVLRHRFGLLGKLC